MRIVLLALALTACATMEPESSADACGATRVAGWVGKFPTDSLMIDVGRRSGARRVRWIHPGDAVTMDYSAERLNVHLDERGIIQRFVCG